VVSWRTYLAALSLLGALLTASHSRLLAELLAALLFALLTPEVLQLAVLALNGGWPLPDILCLKHACLETTGREYCAFCGVKVTDCRHGCYDLSEKEFFSLSTTFFHVGLVGGDAEYLLITWNQQYYVVIRACGKDPYELRRTLKKHLRRVEEALSLTGCSWERMNGQSLRRVLRPSCLVPSGKSPLRLAVAGLVLLPLVLRAPFLLPVGLAGLAALLLSQGRGGYTAASGLHVYTLVSIDSFYSLASLSDILSRAKIVYSSCAKDLYLALRVRPAAPEEEQAIDTEAYRSYEVGTALEKLSLIHRSTKFFAAARRRWERREALYTVSGLLVATQSQQKILERIGLRFIGLPSALEVIS
jgi:hypothetical protein